MSHLSHIRRVLRSKPHPITPPPPALCSGLGARYLLLSGVFARVTGYNKLLRSLFGNVYVCVYLKGEERKACSALFWTRLPAAIIPLVRLCSNPHTFLTSIGWAADKPVSSFFRQWLELAQPLTPTRQSRSSPLAGQGVYQQAQYGFSSKLKLALMSLQSQPT